MVSRATIHNASRSAFSRATLISSTIAFVAFLGTPAAVSWASRSLSGMKGAPLFSRVDACVLTVAGMALLAASPAVRLDMGTAPTSAVPIEEPEGVGPDGKSFEAEADPGRT